MTSMVLCAPNWMKDTDNTPILSGGSYSTDYPVTNLRTGYFVEGAVATDNNPTSTTIHVKFPRYPQPIGFIAIPDAVIPSNAQVRIRGSILPAWSGVVVVEGNQVIGDTTLTVQTFEPVTFTAGDTFRIAGHDTVYQVTSTTTVNATTGDISIRRDSLAGTGLTHNITDGAVLECLVGDYTPAGTVSLGAALGGLLLSITRSGIPENVDLPLVYDSGVIDFLPQLEGETNLSYPWGHESVWTNRIAQFVLDKQGYGKQFTHLLETVTQMRYIKIEVFAQTSPVPCQFSKLYLCHAKRPSINMQYGVEFSTRSNSVKEVSSGGAVAFNRQRPVTTVKLFFYGMGIAEALEFIFDTYRDTDQTDDFYFVWDEADTLLSQKRTFPCYITNTELGFALEAFDTTRSTDITIEQRIG